MNKILKHKNGIIFFEFIAVMLPFFIISFFVFPVADDYSYGFHVHNTWVMNRENGVVNFLGLIKDICVGSFDSWKYARGEYISNLVTSLMPSAFGEKYTWINALILMGTYGVGIYYVCKILFQRIAKLPFKAYAVCFFFTTFYCTSFLPSVAQGFYWYNGAFYNLAVTGIGIMLVTQAVYDVINEKKITLGRQIVILVKSFVVGGGNLSALLAIMVVYTLLMGYVLYERRKPSRVCFSYFIPYIFFAGCNFFAPCNLHLHYVSEDYSYKDAIVGVLRETPGLWVRWTFKTPLFLLLIIFLIILWCNIKIEYLPKKVLPNPFFLFVLIYCTLMLMICPLYYGRGYVGERRVQNVYFIVYTCLMVGATFYTVYYIKYWQISKKHCEGAVTKWIVKHHKIIVAILGFFLIFSSFYNGLERSSNIVLAYENIIDGRIVRYRDLMEERLETYAEHQGENVIVSGIDEDYSLYLYYDITDDDEAWINQTVAKYYGLKSVKTVMH